MRHFHVQSITGAEISMTLRHWCWNVSDFDGGAKVYWTLWHLCSPHFTGGLHIVNMGKYKKAVSIDRDI